MPDTGVQKLLELMEIFFPGFCLLFAAVLAAKEQDSRRGKHLCCEEAGSRWLVWLDTALRSTTGTDIFWPAGARVLWWFLCPSHRAGDGESPTKLRGRLTEPPAIPSFTFQTDQPALSWILARIRMFLFCSHSASSYFW